MDAGHPNVRHLVYLAALMPEVGKNELGRTLAIYMHSRGYLQACAVEGAVRRDLFGASASVDDAKTGDAFAVEVRPQDHALDVFHHPYAYAAWRGVDTRALQAA